MSAAAHAPPRAAETEFQPGRSIFWKYVVFFVALVGGVLLASGALEMYFSYRESQRALLAVQREKAQAAVAIIEEFVQDIEDQIRWTVLPRGITGAAVLEARREDYFRLQRQVPAIAEIRHLDAAGREQLRMSRLRLNQVGSGRDYSNDPAFAGARRGTYFSPINFRSGSEPYMTIAMADRSSEGGVTVADVNLKFIREVISRVKIGQAGYAYVLDSAGQLIAHSDISLVLQNTNLSSLSQFQAARNTAGVPGAQDGGALIAEDRDGKRVLTAYQRVAPTGWWVYVEQPLSEAFAPLISSLLRTIVLLAFGLVMAILASLFLAGKMVTPIRALQAGAGRIAGGALDQRIEVRTGDELEALAHEFNHMTLELQELYAHLDGKVKERTRELAKALEEIGEKSNALEVASRHKSEFLAAMSHELRTPLNAIIGFSDALLERLFGDVNDRQERYLRHILTSAQHLLALITDILDLSRVEAGRMTLELRRFSVAAALEDGLSMISERAHRQHVVVSLTLDPAVREIEADERKFKQIVFNLLSNAVKFTPDGGQVEVAAEAVDSALRVVVRDTGMGIAPEDQERIFEAFEQAGPRSSGLQEGTGLGLALTKQFVELHGGRIWVESVLGRGSTFSVELPLRQPSAGTPDVPVRAPVPRDAAAQGASDGG